MEINQPAIGTTSTAIETREVATGSLTMVPTKSVPVTQAAKLVKKLFLPPGRRARSTKPPISSKTALVNTLSMDLQTTDTVLRDPWSRKMKSSTRE